MQVKITEGLHIDLKIGMWCCTKCGAELVSCYNNYKEGCLVSERQPSDVHRPLVQGKVTFSPDPDWCRILEYYCPECGLLIEVEYLPLGHPPIYDIQLDIESLKAKLGI